VNRPRSICGLENMVDRDQDNSGVAQLLVARCSRSAFHNRAVTRRTGASVMPDQQMPDEGVNSPAALPAKFGVFMNR
jgi:hypothetical protein